MKQVGISKTSRHVQNVRVSPSDESPTTRVFSSDPRNILSRNRNKEIIYRKKGKYKLYLKEIKAIVCMSQTPPNKISQMNLIKR